MTVVGVVGDMKQDALGTETAPMTYEPIYQQPNGPARFYRTVNVVARTSGDTNATIPAVRSALQRIDPALPVTRAEALDAVVTESVKPQRFSMTVVSAFALVALGLATIGIYGVLANVVAQETHEIGVRMALGAAPSAVLWSVLRRSLALMATGVAIGSAGSLAVTRVMTGLLYEVQPTDAAAFGGAAVLLAVLALGASLVPAWRATRIDPLIALRAE
jgi:ABC-type antimicrobial peptide transport system permease subunit